MSGGRKICVSAICLGKEGVLGVSAWPTGTACPAMPPPPPLPQVLSRLIKGFNFRFQPRWHAVDLVETLHVVLGMLDRLAAAGGCGGAWVRGCGGEQECLTADL